MYSRSTSTNGWYGTSISSSHRPCSTTAPSSAAMDANAASRVLPMPGSPARSTMWRGPPGRPPRQRVGGEFSTRPTNTSPMCRPGVAPCRHGPASVPASTASSVMSRPQAGRLPRLSPRRSARSTRSRSQSTWQARRERAADLGPDRVGRAEHVGAGGGVSVTATAASPSTAWARNSCWSASVASSNASCAPRRPPPGRARRQHPSERVEQLRQCVLVAEPARQPHRVSSRAGATRSPSAMATSPAPPRRSSRRRCGPRELGQLEHLGEQHPGASHGRPGATTRRPG